MRFLLDDEPIGRIDARESELLSTVLPTAAVEGDVMRWKPGTLSPELRSRQIQAAAVLLRERGAIRGWRDERYRCERPVPDPCLAFSEELFSLERSAFRFFGLMSRAVHINGWRRDGRIWCGRRAPGKAIDPGRLDNLAAGGLPAGEAVLDCARRELFEEAGVPSAQAWPLEDRGAVRTQREEAEGWHDEVLHVFDLLLPDDFVPANQDGEVSEFLLLDLTTLIERQAEFTADAWAALQLSSVLQARS